MIFFICILLIISDVEHVISYFSIGHSYFLFSELFFFYPLATFLIGRLYFFILIFKLFTIYAAKIFSPLVAFLL